MESCLKRRGYHLLRCCVLGILDDRKIKWLDGELGVELGNQTLEKPFDS